MNLLDDFNRGVTTDLTPVARRIAKLVAQVAVLREALQDVLAETDLLVTDEIVRGALNRAAIQERTPEEQP